MADADWVRLNVGGTIFLTTKSTLRNEPSFLSHVLGGGVDENSFSSAPLDADGCVRIDRSPAIFDAVLDYLRNLEDFVPPAFPSRDFTLLEREAKFYALEGLSRALALVREDASSDSLSSSARIKRSFVNCGGDRLVHISGLPDVVTDQQIFLSLEKLSLRSLSSDPVIPFPQPSFLRTLRDPLSPIAGGGFACKGAAIVAYNSVAHAARALAAVNAGPMPVIEGNPLSGVTLVASWADAPNVPPFAFEEASIMSIEIGPNPNVVHARPLGLELPAAFAPQHVHVGGAAAAAPVAAQEDPLQAALQVGLRNAFAQAVALQANNHAAVGAQALVANRAILQNAMAVLGGAQAQVAAALPAGGAEGGAVPAGGAQVLPAPGAAAGGGAGGIEPAGEAAGLAGHSAALTQAFAAARAGLVGLNPADPQLQQHFLTLGRAQAQQLLAHYGSVLSHVRAQIASLNGALANTERELAHAPAAGASQALVNDLETRRGSIIAHLQALSRQEQELERMIAAVRAGHQVAAAGGGAAPAAP
jgi:hypothetical protein